MERRLLWAASAALFVAALDAYAVVTLLPGMLSSLELSVDRLEQATPVVSGFLGGYVVAMPLVGAVSDARGRLPVFTVACLAFGLGSLVTGLASSLPQLVVGRVLQGLGGGALVPVGFALAADVFSSSRSRLVALGLVAALQEAGSVFGPVWGSWLASVFHGDWRPVFFVSGGLVLVICGVGVLAARGAAGLFRARTVAAVDWVGGALLGASLLAGVLALYPDDPSVRPVNAWFWPMAAVCVLLLGAYLFRTRALRAVRPRLWAALGSNFLAGVGLMVALVDIPILARAVYSYDQAGAGLLLMRFLAGVPVGALVGGWLASAIGRRVPALAGFLLAGAMFLWMSRFGAQSWPALLAGGAGFGFVISPLSALVLEVGGASSHGGASASFVVARTVGMLAGLSGLTAFGLRRFYAILASLTAASPCSGSLSAQFSCLDRHVKAALLQEYQEVFLITAVVCLAALVLAAVSLAEFGAGRARPAGAG